jgi:hypothetical protein
MLEFEPKITKGGRPGTEIESSQSSPEEHGESLKTPAEDAEEAEEEPGESGGGYLHLKPEAQDGPGGAVGLDLEAVGGGLDLSVEAEMGQGRNLRW